uniref:Uncharacterized protein n=1 Tax=Odontella aurita TaxID=265563 RepID=A0A7S4IRR0_9STRA
MTVADNTGGKSDRYPRHIPMAEDRQVINDDVRINLSEDSPTAAARRRRRQIPSALGLSSSTSGGGGGTAFHYAAESDSEGENHGGRSKKMFNRSCPIGQFFLDPCLFLSVRTRMCLALLSRGVGRQRGGQREMRRRGGGHFDVDAGRTLAAAAAASLAVVILLRRALSGGSGLVWRRRGDYPPVLIPAFDYSQSNDIGGWMTPYEFPRLASLKPMHPERWSIDVDDDSLEEEEEEEEEKSDSSDTKIEHVKDDRDPNSFGKPDYGGIIFQSLKGADGTNFRRVIDMDADYKYVLNLGEYVQEPHVSHTYA